MGVKESRPRPAGALRRAGTYAGVAGAVVAFGAILGAVALAPWFSWTGNALSDLGRPSRATAPLFNWGLVVAGALGVAFAARVGLAAENAVQGAGAALLGATLADMALIGAFPLGTALHGPVSVAFFVGLTYGLLVFGSGDVLAGRPRRGLLAVWLATANVTGWAAFAAGLVGPGVALPELVGAVAVGAWAVAVTAGLTDGRVPGVGRSG